MNNEGSMNIVLRRVATVMGLILLGISIYWSQDGFNFNIAGDSGGTDAAILIGYTIAIAVTVVQFVFSTNLRELNASLIVFGIIAYGYSIYTNYQGIVHFQGSTPNNIMAAVLGFAMDGVPEPLIAWGLRESLSGDFVGNIFKGFGAWFTGKPIGGGKGTTNAPPPKHQGNQNNQGNSYKGKPKGSDRRRELENQYMGADRRKAAGKPSGLEELERFKMRENNHSEDE